MQNNHRTICVFCGTPIITVGALEESGLEYLENDMWNFSCALSLDFRLMGADEGHFRWKIGTSPVKTVDIM